MALGMRAAIDEVKKNLAPNRLNRVLVLTDGQTYEETACIDLVEQNRDQMSFSTMGVGVEFNEKLLQRIAQDSNGKYHFIGNPAEIPGIFEDELAGTARGQHAQRADRSDAVAGRAGARGVSRQSRKFTRSARRWSATIAKSATRSATSKPACPARCC